MKKRKSSLARDRDKRKIQNEKLQKRVKKGQEKSQGRQKNVLKSDANISLWRPKDGDHIVDVVPYLAGKYDPDVEEGDPTYTYEYWAHTRVGPNDAMVLCLTEMFDKPCPICEDRQRLREKGAKEEVWKKLFPKRRNLYNIICYDKGEEKKGVQVWDISWHYFEKKVLAISKRPARHGKKEKTVNFASTEKGRSVNFTIEPAKSKNDYPEYLGHSFDERDYTIDEGILEEAVTLDEAIYKPKYDEVKKLYLGEGDKGGGGTEELEELIEGLEEIEDFDDFEEFIENNDLDVKIKKKWSDEKIIEKITEALEEGAEEGEDSKKSDKQKYDADDIEEMKEKKLKKLIEDEELDVDPDDADDVEELREMIIDELGLDED